MTNSEKICADVFYIIIMNILQIKKTEINNYRLEKNQYECSSHKHKNGGETNMINNNSHMMKAQNNIEKSVLWNGSMRVFFVFVFVFLLYGLKLNIQKTKIMASGPIISRQIEGEKSGSSNRFSFLGLPNHSRQ